MNASARSIRARAHARRPRVTLVLRVPMQIKHLMMLMSTADREHLVTRAVKQAIKESSNAS